MSFTNLAYHIVFGTKERRPCITTIKDDLHAYLGGAIRGERGIPIAVGGVADHVHLLVKLPASVAVADVVRVIKANSSKWAGERDSHWCGWQSGYAAFSVSQSNVEAVAEYVRGQEEHHRRRTFEEEFVALLERHGIEYDERYLWE